MNMCGFYKNENNALLFGSKIVENKNYTLNSSNKDNYVYPIDGWYWFETEEEARLFFNLPKPTPPEEPIHIHISK